MTLDSNLNGNHILVTGGAGYIGSMLIHELLRVGVQVTVLDKLVYGGEPLLSYITHQDIQFIEGDVRDEKLLESLLVDVDYVVHLAAVVGDPACKFDSTNSWDINVNGTRALMSAIGRSTVRGVLFASTCSNYGISSTDSIADESSRLHPLSLYAESKVQAETDILASEGDFCVNIFRFATICGLSPRMRFDLLVSDVARAAVLGQPIQIFAPEAWRPFLHVQDACSFIRKWLGLTTADRVRINRRVYNLVGENYRKSDLAALVKKHFPASLIEIDERSPDARDYRVSANLVLSELGWGPSFTVEEAFLEVAHAVGMGAFRNPMWEGYSATPLQEMAFERRGN